MSEELSDKQIFVQNLRRLLSLRGATQTELAKNVGVSPSMVTHWLQGKNHPRIDVMQKIATYFEVPINDLIVDKDNANAVRFAAMLSKLPDEKKLAFPSGFEPKAFRLGGERSIQHKILVA